MAGRNPVCNTVIADIISKIGAIRAVNSYNYDVDSDYVFDWLDKPINIDDDNLHINVMDFDSDQEQVGGYAENDLEVHVVLSKNGDGARAYIRKSMQDILQCMFNDFLPNNSDIRNIDYRGTQPVYDREKRLMGDAEMVFNLFYKTQLGEI